MAGAIYHVVFRLVDALPAAVVETWKRELAEMSARENRCELALHGGISREQLAEKVEQYLDAGRGACWLGRPVVARLMHDALLHFDNERYQLHAWCVMPNHVHAVVQPLGPCSLLQILKSWKGFVALAANRYLGRTGAFWQPEYYDHLLRDEAEFAHAVRYVLANPVKAGLDAWEWKGASPAAHEAMERILGKAP